MHRFRNLYLNEIDYVVISNNDFITFCQNQYTV